MASSSAPSLMTSSPFLKIPLSVPHPPSSNPPSPYYISHAFYICFPFTLPYVSVIVKTAVIAALKQRTVLRSTSSFFYYTSTLPLSTPCPSRSLTYTQYPCFHLYRGPVSLLPPLLWPCCLTSTSTMALLPYFHLCRGPVALLPHLLWPCCIISTSTVHLLPHFHLYRGPVALCYWMKI